MDVNYFFEKVQIDEWLWNVNIDSKNRSQHNYKVESINQLYESGDLIECLHFIGEIENKKTANNVLF